jgi:hypothetical protein
MASIPQNIHARFSVRFLAVSFADEHPGIDGHTTSMLTPIHFKQPHASQTNNMHHIPRLCHDTAIRHYTSDAKLTVATSQAMQTTTEASSVASKLSRVARFDPVKLVQKLKSLQKTMTCKNEPSPMEEVSPGFKALGFFNTTLNVP